MFELLSVGAGGFLGASLRYLISAGMNRLTDTHLPMGTLFVNVLGGLLMGFIMEWSLHDTSLSPRLRLFLTTGLLGGLTTFSTFSYETISLASKGIWILAFANAGLNLILSLIGVLLGQQLARLVLPL